MRAISCLYGKRELWYSRPPDVHELVGRNLGRLAIDKVSHTFCNGQAGIQVLDNVSFDVAHSEFVSLLGPFGPGYKP